MKMIMKKLVFIYGILVEDEATSNHVYNNAGFLKIKTLIYDFLVWI